VSNFKKQIREHPIMKKPLCQLAFVAAVLGCCLSSARAVVIVAEDFLYNEPTKALFDFAGFTRASYGGGQNGPSGVWDDRWTAIGGVVIVGTDNPPAPYDVNPHTAVITEVATAASLQRPFLSTAGASTIYFAADVKLDDVSTPQIFMEYGILSPANNLGVPSLSMGVTDTQGAIAASFFAKIGNTTLTADPAANPANALAAGAYVRMVGKLEVNAVPGTGDFDRNGFTDGNDFLLWQRQLGTNIPANTGADGDGNGMVNGADLTLWKGAYGQTGAERLTVYFNPTGVETTAATVLTGTGSIIDSFDASALTKVVSLNGLANVGDSDRPHYVDNIAIGTTWADVATVNVPRLTLEVNTATGQTRLINNSTTAVNLAYYEILSESDSLNATTWNSLDDQNTSGGTWAENSPNAGQLIESNLTSSTTIAAGGGTLSLGAAFSTTGTQDLVARWGVKQGFDGLLNLANVVYVGAAAAAVPEPAAWCLLALGAAVVRRQRERN
jgi:hypothetical protein